MEPRVRGLRPAFALRPPDTVRSWYEYALLHVLLVDESAYGRVCRQMAERFGGSDDVFPHSHPGRALIPDAAPALPAPAVRFIHEFSLTKNR